MPIQQAPARAVINLRNGPFGWSDSGSRIAAYRSEACRGHRPAATLCASQWQHSNHSPANIISKNCTDMGPLNALFPPPPRIEWRSIWEQFRRTWRYKVLSSSLCRRPATFDRLICSLFVLVPLPLPAGQAWCAIVNLEEPGDCPYRLSRALSRSALSNLNPLEILRTLCTYSLMSSSAQGKQNTKMAAAKNPTSAEAKAAAKMHRRSRSGTFLLGCMIAELGQN